LVFYGSTEWLNLFQENLNSSKEFAKAAGNFSASMLVATEIKGLPKIMYVWLDLHNGKLRDWAYIATPKEKKSDFIFTSGYYTWKSICRGDMDVIKAVLSGKIKLTGNKLKLIKQTRMSLALLEVMKQLPTTFPDDAFQRQ